MVEEDVGRQTTPLFPVHRGEVATLHGWDEGRRGIVQERVVLHVDKFWLT